MHRESGDEVFGLSEGPFQSLNLGLKVGDQAEVVQSNRKELAAVIGLSRLRFMDQIHSSICEVVTDPSMAEKSVDGMVMARERQSNEMAESVGLVVQVADCVPLILESENAIGAVHVGREGLIKGMTESAISKMREASDHDKISATIGPSICGNCYPLSAELYHACTVKYPASNFDESSFKVDVAAAVRSILENEEISCTWFAGQRECVSCDSDYFSYRRDGITGRQAMVVAFE